MPPAACVVPCCAAQVKHGPQPYAHVKASMVRLPYACSIGRDSLLATLVSSNVPVKVRAALRCSVLCCHARALLQFVLCCGA